jgi:hypothetical protein
MSTTRRFPRTAYLRVLDRLLAECSWQWGRADLDIDNPRLSRRAWQRAVNRREDFDEIARRTLQLRDAISTLRS